MILSEAASVARRRQVTPSSTSGRSEIGLECPTRVPLYLLTCTWLREKLPNTAPIGFGCYEPHAGGQGVRTFRRPNRVAQSNRGSSELRAAQQRRRAAGICIVPCSLGFSQAPNPATRVHNRAAFRYALGESSRGSPLPSPRRPLEAGSLPFAIARQR